jgi:hypothetical protein
MVIPEVGKATFTARQNPPAGDHLAEEKSEVSAPISFAENFSD